MNEKLQRIHPEDWAIGSSELKSIFVYVGIRLPMGRPGLLWSQCVTPTTGSAELLTLKYTIVFVAVLFAYIYKLQEHRVCISLGRGWCGGGLGR